MRVTTIIEIGIRRKGREWLAIYTFLLQMDDVSSGGKHRHMTTAKVMT
jgi:hypothetical protein